MFQGVVSHFRVWTMPAHLVTDRRCRELTHLQPQPEPPGVGHWAGTQEPSRIGCYLHNAMPRGLCEPQAGPGVGTGSSPWDGNCPQGLGREWTALREGRCHGHECRPAGQNLSP